MENKKIKILFVTEGLGNGGKERELIEFLRNINKEKFQTGVLSFNNFDFYREDAINYSDEYFEFYKNKNKYKIFLKIFNVFKKFKPDFIINFDLLSSIYTYLPSYFYNFKIIDCSIQDTGLDKGWHKILKIYFLKRADKVISNTKKGLEVYGVKGEVIYNIINPNRFKAKKEHTGFNICMIANFTEYKDYDSYFRLSDMLLKGNHVDKVYAVGRGKNLEHYKAKFKVEERIIFTGAINNVEEFLQEMDAGFLFSTEEFGEGLSNTLLEYLASGTLAFATDIGASNEIIENGVNGFLIDKNNPEDVIKIIDDVKNGKIEIRKIIDNARKTINEKFSMKVNMDKFENIFYNLT